MSPQIISVGNFKGGVGKSLVTASLVAEYTRRGVKVLVADADPQRTISSWASFEDGVHPDLIGFSDTTPLRQMADHYERIIVDTPPAHPGLPGEQLHSPAARAMMAALLEADYALMVVTPDPSVLWSFSDALGLLQRVRMARETPLDAGVLINRQKPRGRLDTGIRKSLEGSSEPILDTALSDLIGYRLSFLQGQGASTWIQDDGRHVRDKAHKEVEALVDELEAHFSAKGSATHAA